MEEIAYALGKDPLEVRRANFYGDTDRNVTPYHQTVTDNIIHRIVDELEASSDYPARREAILAHNAKGGVIRKGIALTPVKFGISFTATWYNQAGALVHVYNDGSVHLNHGGTEMGQGLNTKVSQVVADVFQIDLDRVKITATTTAKVPNTSATAASSGSDLNGMAAQNAAEQIKNRLIDFAAEKYSVDREQVVFEPNRVLIGNRRIAFDDLIKEAYLGRVHLSAAGFYKTPEIHWDRAAGKGRPFYYFAYGAACLRGLRRHPDRRVPRRPHRHPARRRPLAEPGDRQGPGRGRLHPGRRLADHRGTVVGRGGPPAHPRPLDLQDPARLRPPGDLQRQARRPGPRTASRRSAAPRRSASRRSCSASRSSKPCRWPSPASPATGPARASRPRRPPSAS